MEKPDRSNETKGGGGGKKWKNLIDVMKQREKKKRKNLIEAMKQREIKKKGKS